MKMIPVLLLIVLNSNANIPSITVIRDQFRRSAMEKRSCEELIMSLDSYNEKNNPLLAGYKAAGTMIWAKYHLNPFVKLSYFLKGKVLLEKAIAADRKNIELRFLRYTIQTKAPSFLQYRSSLKEDKLMLVRAQTQLNDQELNKMITEFLKTDGAVK